MYVLLHRASDMWKITSPTGMFMLIGIIALADRRVNASCPLELNPPSVVARYGESVSANCTTSETQHDGMGWESKSGNNEPVYDVNSVVWDVANLQEWDASPICYINIIDGEQCLKKLPVVVYKEPDSVSISHSSHIPMVEGTAYQLQCDIINVAPVRNITVIWYKEHKTIHMQSYDSLTSVTPVNESSTLTITPGRDDNGAQVYCQAQINIGPSGPNPFPSQPHIMTVYYPPTFLSSQTETVDQADDITLDCTATGNPTPTYRWQCSNANQEQILQSNHSVITTKMFPGICNCTASNDVGIETKQFIINIPKVNHSRTTFWAMVGPPVAIAVLALIGYVYKTKKATIL